MEFSKPDNFDTLAFDCGKQIHRHTIQFLIKGGKYGYKPYGSGVLLTVDNKCIILTAAHVIQNFEKTPLYINSVNGIIPVVGDLRQTDLTKDKGTDLAYIILHDKIASFLIESYDFISISKVIHSHIPFISNQYLVVGYLEASIKAEAKERTVYTGTTTFLLTPSKDKVYEYYSLDKVKHYVLDFAGKGIDIETNEKTGQIVDPYGISGCGLWLLTGKANTNPLELEYRLIGIMTEFRKGKYHCLIGNRIERIMDALIQLDKFNIKPSSK